MVQKSIECKIFRKHHSNVVETLFVKRIQRHVWLHFEALVKLLDFTVDYTDSCAKFVNGFIEINRVIV